MPVHRRVATVRAVVGLALASIVLAPSAAFAHAELTGSNPEDGSTVRVMPDEISLTLSEPVREPAFVVVTSADGTRVDSAEVTVAGDTVTTAIDEPAPAGDYTVAYRLVSADAHTVSGSLEFEVLAGPSPTPSATPPVPTASPDPSAASAEAAPIESPESSGVSDALIVLGFTVLAMIGLGLLLRAGLKSSGAEDVD